MSGATPTAGYGGSPAPGSDPAQPKSWFAEAAKAAEPAQSNGAPQPGAQPSGPSFENWQPSGPAHGGSTGDNGPAYPAQTDPQPFGDPISSGPGHRAPADNGPADGGSPFNGPAYNGPGHHGPANGGPGSNGPAFDGPAFDGPGSNGPGSNGAVGQGPAFNGQADSGPAHNGPAHSGPAHSGPAHSAPAQAPWPAENQSAPSFDPESTAAWSLAEEPPSGPYARPQPPPEPTGQSGWSMPAEEPRNGESIVPDSWFAGPRAADPREADAQGPAVWTPQSADPDATMQVSWGSQPQAPSPGPGQFGQPGPQQFGFPGQQQQFGPPQNNQQNNQQFAQPAPGQQQFGNAPAGQGWGQEQRQDWSGAGHSNETAMLPGPVGGPPYGPSGPDSGMHGGNPPQKSEASRSLIIAVALLVVAAVSAVAFVMWPSGDPQKPTESKPAAVNKTSKPSTSTAGRQQAVAVNGVLNASGASRGELGRALASARKCDGLGTAIAGMQNVARQRQAQINQTRALKVNKLANGVRLRATLAKAINLSLEVDRAYLAWAQANQRKCKGRPKANADYTRGGRLSAQASSVKQQFAVLWAPVAQKEGLQRRGATSF